METGEIIGLPADGPGNGGENNEPNQHGDESCSLDFQSEKLESEEAKEIGEISGSSGDDADGDNQLLLVADNGNNMLDDPPSLEISFERSETVTVTKKRDSFLPRHADNGCLDKEDEFPLSDREIFASSLSGVKRPRVTVDEEQPFVRVTYKSLTRDSKRKLKDLLQEWSQWHAHHCSSSNESGKALESGEDTFYPAIQIGVDKSSALSFWMESETRDNINEELMLLDEKSVPLYDRGFSLALTSTNGSNNLRVQEVVEGSRCFNCGSYNHSLKECPKPRDNVAVTTARKQHSARRNQNASSRNATRYYQNSPGGKYDGLKPGTLDSETRQLLGLGELDPPPWLNRMREIGYPPGYLDANDEDQPSGITIFGDDENMEDSEEGEILERSVGEKDKRKSVKFPGVNAPIPENADEKRWAARSSDVSSYRNRPYSSSRSHYHDQRPPRGGFEDDEPPPLPPGCDDERSTMYSYSRRYGVVDPDYYSHSPRNSSFGRSSDRGRRNPLVHDGSSFSYGHLSSSSPR